jgi:hypothetical protein
MGRDDLEDCLAAIMPQVDHTILITHNYKMDETFSLHSIPYEREIPNISEMWNLGLDLASYLGADFTAVLNDDAIVYNGWFSNIENAMVATQSIAGWSSGEHEGHLVYRKAEPTLIRMTGFAFVVRSQVRADEQFQWWCGDNDIEWNARVAGGVVHVGGRSSTDIRTARLSEN